MKVSMTVISTLVITNLIVFANAVLEWQLNWLTEIITFNILSLLYLVWRCAKNHRYKQKLVDSYHMRSFIFNHSPLAILRLNTEQQITETNERVSQLLGWINTLIIGNSAAKVLPELDVIIGDWKKLGANEDLNKQTIALTKSGEAIPVELVVKPDYKKGGCLLYIRDITQKLEAERETQQLQDAIESSFDGFMLFDASDRLIKANHRMNELYTSRGSLFEQGQTYKEVLQQGLSLGLFPQAIGIQEKWLQTALNNHHTPVGELEIELNNGRWVRVTEQKTSFGGTLSFHTDITDARRIAHELKCAKDYAEQANHAKARFLAMMSHEIRTPLNGVLGMLELLVDDPLSDKQKVYLATAEDAGNSLLTVINDILDYSKMEANRFELNSGPFKLPAMVNRVGQLLKVQAAHKGIELKCQIDSGVPIWCHADSARIRQVLMNLTGNAVKFTNQGIVRIHLSLLSKSSLSAHIRFDVIDTGEGISESDQQKLFNEFSTLDQSYARQREGTGLGLVISKRLVELMGGSLSVRSQIGEGSTFSFELEIDTVPAQQQPKSETPTVVSHFDNRKILLVEDNTTNQIVADAMLSKLGCDIKIVSSGFEAIHYLTNHCVDLVLMDISMPKMDGIETCQKIRSLSLIDESVPVVAMTAHALTDEKQFFFTSGMNDYLEKPVRQAQLHKLFSKWLGGEEQNKAPSFDVNVSLEAPPASVAELAGPEVLCIDVLEQLAKDTDVQLLPTLSDVFLKDAKVRVARIEQAIKSTDSAMLKIETHTLGSSAAAYGLMPLKDASRKVELLCNQQEFEQAFIEAQCIMVLAEQSFIALENYISNMKVQSE